MDCDDLQRLADDGNPITAADCLDCGRCDLCIGRSMAAAEWTEAVEPVYVEGYNRWSDPAIEAHDLGGEA